ncbi:hypothetical protein E3N88_08739 [Mikania micrantha]|uniref:RING-type E3 ubiquitin transferase n=1 Tax=Mikania micrantha TaxID=192012 RepID=A0A5N6PJD5_9ASTR|nr:hypothetical protein E3N88_08739 [Mikania micrantha]
MGQQNMSNVCPKLDVEPQQVPHHPEPCMVYNHPILSPPTHNLPENHRQLPYVNSHHNCEHCNTHMTSSPSAGVVSAPVNHDHLPFLNNRRIFERDRSLFMDGSNGVFKGSGSSVTVPMTSEGNRATGAMGSEFDPVVGRNSSHLVRGGQLFQSGPSGSFSHPYLQGFHGYQVVGMSRNSQAFIPPPLRPHQGCQNVYCPPLPPTPPPPMLPVQAQNTDAHLQLPSTSHRSSTRTSRVYPFQNDVDPGPRFEGPALSHGPMAYAIRRQQVMSDSIARHRSFRHLRVLQEEAILSLSEQIGNADSGLMDNFISARLKTRTFVSFRHHSIDLTPPDEEPNFCVICQMEFEDQESIGLLDCCHEFHAECIKKWLKVKNNCPICKNAALH